ncbi:transaldolase family protein [Chlamydiota bacterium]
MDIWLDTIDLGAIKRAASMGLLDGVTTNPTLLSEAKEPAEEVLENLLNHFSGPLAVQVTLRSADEMVEQGKDLRDFSSRIIVKIPVTEEGLVAIQRLSNGDIPVMATAILNPMQALLAAKAGALYLAPYFSYLGENALTVCQTMQRMQLSAKLLIASLKSPEHVIQCAASGFDAITIKGPLFQTCITPPSETLEHLKRFEAAWQAAPPSQLLTSTV